MGPPDEQQFYLCGSSLHLQLHNTTDQRPLFSEIAALVPYFNDLYKNLRWREGQQGLQDMCDFAAEKYLEDETLIVRFDVFNALEADAVRNYMRSTHPGVPFFTTRCV